MYTVICFSSDFKITLNKRELSLMSSSYRGSTVHEMAMQKYCY